jgi:hypothetical protein
LKLQLQDLLLFAFGFGNLAMLGWLAAAAAPLLIHLWSRHRFREAPWAAMQFLLAAMRKNARRLQLQQWLLLAVRTLLIVLVVLAVAEPYGEHLLAGGSGAPSHKIMVIDASYSMGYQTDGRTNFAAAKQLASELVKKSPSGDVFTLLFMTSSPKLVLGPELIDHTEVASRIESLTPSCEGANLEGTLTLVQKSLTPKEGRRLPDRKEVYFFADLQRRTWGPLENTNQPASDATKAQTLKAVESLSQLGPLNVIDVGKPNASNLAVTNLATSDTVITRARDVNLEATLHAFGPDSPGACRVELLIDDAPVAEQTIEIAAGADASVHFSHRFTSPGEHVVTIRATNDHLEIDNSRSLVVPVCDEVRVLCVAGREGAAKYLAGALNPNPAGDSPIRPVIISEGDLAETKLVDFDCVFICNVPQITPGEAERLKRYAENGGGVVFFLGDRVLPDQYNAIANRATETPATSDKDSKAAIVKQPLIPAKIGELIAQQQFGLDPLDYRHPIVAPFRGRERAGLLTTPVARHYRLDVSKSAPGTEVAAALPGGDPFIVTAPLGRGRTVLIATDGSLASVDASGEPWTTWPTWPSFLPIVRELLSYAMSGQHDRWQQLIGIPLTGTITDSANNGQTGGELQMERPDGRITAVALQPARAGWEWQYTDTNVNGVYTLRGLPHGRIRKFAVNVDAAEGDLARVDVEHLPRELKVRSTWRDDATSNVAANIVSQSAWNQSLLWLVLALLFIESFMAWQFGRGNL